MYTTWRQRLFRQIILTHDLLWTSLIWSMVLIGQWGWSTWWQSAHIMLPTLLFVQALNWGLWRVQNASWRFFSWVDLENIIKAIVGMHVLVLMANQWLWPNPVSIITVFIHMTLLSQVLLGMRFVYRKIRMSQSCHPGTKKRALIIGADERAVNIIRACQSDRYSPYTLVGLIDDTQPAGVGKDILGVRVLGGMSTWSDVAKAYQIDDIIFSKKWPPEILETMMITAKQSGWDVLIYPDNIEAASLSRPVLDQIRPIHVEDLLGRAPVKVGHDDLSALIDNQVAIVTGGGGSIGSELCRQLLEYHPKTLVIVDNNEYNLFSLQQELKTYESVKTQIHYALGSTNDEHFIARIFSKYQPNLLFHAAAYKHVPLLEAQVTEAMKNNVLSTLIVSEQAQKYGIQRGVLVSTDKAVHPTNVMGATKRLCEQVWMQPHSQKTQFGIVRFGNVLGSRGSVVETFTKQLQRGGPLTVTDPKVTRYFMTIPEAAQLILQAASFQDIEAIFVLDMGQPVQIADLAKKMIELSGQTTIDIQYTGLRPGEKTFEELFYSEESLKNTEHPKIQMAKIQLMPCDVQELKKQLMAPYSDDNDAYLIRVLMQYSPSLAQHREQRLM